MNNSLVNNQNNGQQPKAKFSAYITSDAITKSINKMVGQEKGQKFITSIISAVSTNPMLQNCDSSTIVSAALIGESLGLSPSNVMGHYYFVPYKDNKTGRYVAQFQIGYKGYIQLAMRSGQYKDINVIEIKEGEFIGRDEETGSEKFKFITDDVEREKKKTIGYLAYFVLLNGFRHIEYWSVAKMENHAKTFSQGYQRDLRQGSKTSYWVKNFSQMAFKTLLRQLLSKWGIMSIEMQKAFETDQSVVYNDEKIEFVDNPYSNEEEFEPVENANVEEETGEIKEEPKKQTNKKEKVEDIINAFNKHQEEVKENQEAEEQQTLFDNLFS